MKSRMRDLRASNLGFADCPEQGHYDPYTVPEDHNTRDPLQTLGRECSWPSLSDSSRTLEGLGLFCVQMRTGGVTFRLQCKKHRHGMVLRMSFGWPRTPFGQIMMRIPYEMRRRDAGGAVRDRAAAPAAISLEVRHLWEGVDTYWE